MQQISIRFAVELVKGVMLGLLTLMTPMAFGKEYSAGVSAKLVSDQTIATQSALTKSYKLANGIPVTYRKIAGSDILQVDVSFGHGMKDLKAGQKALNRWLWGVVPMAAAGYPKKRVFELTEKYSLELNCGGGIELTSCSLGTLNDHWAVAAPLFGALLTKPSLTDQDAKLVKDRLIANLKNTPSDPGRYINEVVNRVFYPTKHPYRLLHNEALTELKKLTVKDLRNLHKRYLNASIVRVVVVGSLSPAAVISQLDKTLGKLKQGPIRETIVQKPAFKRSEAYSFEHRDIPTAYIRAKFPAPSARHKDATAVRLMFEILSEELGEEIRTKRSLSYSVYSLIIQYSMGIGILNASTSKPKETLEAMQVVIDKIKGKALSNTDLEEYKRVFATRYFLTQETHASLAQAIASSLHFTGSYHKLYSMPKDLAAVTSKDVLRLANQILVDMRLGVLFDKKRFQEKWAQDFITANLTKKKAKG